MEVILKSKVIKCKDSVGKVSENEENKHKNLDKSEGNQSSAAFRDDLANIVVIFLVPAGDEVTFILDSLHFLMEPGGPDGLFPSLFTLRPCFLVVIFILLDTSCFFLSLSFLLFSLTSISSLISISVVVFPVFVVVLVLVVVVVVVVVVGFSCCWLVVDLLAS